MSPKLRLMLLSATVPLLALGCAPRQTVRPVQPAPTPSPTPVASSPRTWDQGETAHYRVRRGDCLWTISAKDSVYGDPWEWPLLFRQNRDEISDPNLIYPDQSLAYRVHPSAADLADARRIAEATPPYHPHRRELPLR